MAKGGGESKGATLMAKGIVIGEKCLWDEILDILSLKKGQTGYKGQEKGGHAATRGKKKGLAAKALTKSKVTSSRTSTKAAPTVTDPGEGTLANPGVILGLNASMLENPTMVEKLLERLIPHAKRDAVEKLDLDWVISKFFHCIGHITICFRIKNVLLHFHSSNKFNFYKWWCSGPPLLVMVGRWEKRWWLNGGWDRLC